MTEAANPVPFLRINIPVMMISFNRKTLSPLSFLFLTSFVVAQNTADRKVTRCSSVSRSAPVHNIYVDAENNKWVASGSGVFQVMGTDLSTPLAMNAGEKSAYGYRGGNADARWSPEVLQMTLNIEPDISTAWYDERNDWLWLGTKESGLYQLKTKPALKLVEKYTSGNSKLKSNTITAIFQDRTGIYWVGTDNGMITGTPGKWKTTLEGYNVQRVRQQGADIYILADGEFWAVRGGDKLEAINLKGKALEGEAEDFDLSPNGNLWILSRMVCRYDLETDEFDVFSGAELYTSEYGRCIAADLDGAIWVGTDDKGLYLIDKSTALIVNCLIDKNLSCTGTAQDAALNVKIEGGKPPYTYAWSAASLQGSNPQNLGAGTYTVTVTDSNGKSKSAKVKIDDPSVSAVATQKQIESAPGKKDGSAEVVVKGGTPEYKYKWDNGESTNPAKKLAEGTHSVTVTDKNGCSATATVAISQQLAALNASIAETTPIPCAGGNTILKVTVNGGKEPYQYEWNNPRMEGNQPTGVSAGTYQLTVVDAAGGKTVTSCTVVQPASISLVATVKSPASTGNSDGKATASPRGGTGAYTYRWDNGETSETATQLKPGNHTLTVNDANGCQATASITVSENILPLRASIEETGKISCSGGQSGLRVLVEGGKSPYEFKWSNAELNGYQPTGVPAGTYLVTISDAAGGKTTATFSIKQPDAITASINVKSAASTGNTDGKAQAQIKGGTAPYQFRWDNGETGETALKLAPGMHSLTVSDVFGCTGTVSASVSENILPLSVSIEETGKISCFGGKASLTANVNGGKAPFLFQWSDPSFSGEKITGVPAGEYTLVITDAANGKTSTAFKVREPEPVTLAVSAKAPASTGNFDGKANAQGRGGTSPYQFRWDNDESGADAIRLAPGTHSLTVTDANGCSASATVTITENILPLTVRIEETQKIKCSGGSAGLQAQVSGGKEPFRYDWNNPAVQGAQPLSVARGDYQLTVTDATGKQVSATITVKEPAAVVVKAVANAPASTGNADGKATAEAKGGTGALRYAWDNGETAATAIKLAPGTHTVTITDENGCAAMAGLAISENILPLAVDVELDHQIKCAGETTALKVAVNGGKPPYKFKWDNPAWTSNQVTGVPSGTYAVLVTDAKGTTQTAVALVNAPDSLRVEMTRLVGATTERTKDGKATVNIKGGTPPLTIAWDNDENKATASKLTQGLHTVTVTDANGCSVTRSATIKQRILPELDAAMLRDGQTIRMEQLRFEADSASLTEDALPTLDELYDFMMENGNIVVEIGGHTNSTPPDEFCDRLSSARAKSAADYVIQKGIDPKRVVYKGYGKRQPIASNATADGRKKNQRVEIKILTLRRQ